MSSRKRIPVKLTAAQWALVTEAVSEWGELCDSEADYADGTRCKGKAKRAEKLERLATAIGVQVHVSEERTRGGEDGDAAGK